MKKRRRLQQLAAKRAEDYQNEVKEVQSIGVINLGNCDIGESPKLKPGGSLLGKVKKSPLQGARDFKPAGSGQSK